jgi:hypothetical protein
MLVALLVSFSACQTARPVKELALADVALKSAQKVKADALAPDAYRQAENYYLRAKKDFADGYFDSSRKFSEQARLQAEKAEYLSLLKQSKLKNPAASPSTYAEPVADESDTQD